MKATYLGLTLAAGLGLVLAGVALAKDGEKGVTLSPTDLKWTEMSPKSPGVMVADVYGNSKEGPWRGFIKSPPGRKSGVHTHSSDLVLVVVSGTFNYGPNPDSEKPYPAGSYIVIPANLPHSNSQPQGTLLYAMQPGKFDSTPVTAAAK